MASTKEYLDFTLEQLSDKEGSEPPCCLCRAV